MTTPEPSPLSEQELEALEEYTRSLVCCACDGPDTDGDHDDDCQAPFWQKVSRAIAQARAAQSALDHAATSLDRYNEANAALQHMAACQPYLKEGEYPEECIERWRKDCNALMTVLAQRTKELEEARAARPSPWQPIETAPKDGTVVWLWNPNQPSVTRYARFCDGKLPRGLAWRTVDKGCVLTYAPTHWQPWPAPPAQDGGRP